MSGPRKGDPKVVREWIAYSRADLHAARLLVAVGPQQADPAAYHCQQCAEKALKAWIIHTGKQHPLTHSIRQLLDVIGRNVAWTHEIADAEVLSSFVISARYPGSGDPATVEDAVEAVKIAANVLSAVETALKNERIDLS
ncbi:MAG: HEPN domain-containing protein [Phycisphaerales bacterium]